jgi:hypothetical protein
MRKSETLSVSSAEIVVALASMHLVLGGSLVVIMWMSTEHNISTKFFNRGQQH